MQSMYSLMAFLCVTACAQSVVAEQVEPPQAPAPPACATETAPYRDFDFWAGSWTVTDLAGDHAGENDITVEENGCLLVERWSGAKGGTGTSLNFVDPKSGHWRQVWMSQGAMIDYSGGLDGAGAMRMEGEITYTRTGLSFPFRGVWTPNDNGSVTQAFTQYDPENDVWNNWFTAIYERRSD